LALGGFGDLNRSGRLSPCLSDPVAVENPEKSCDQQQDYLIDRAWEGRNAECAAPPQRPGDATVANDDLDGAECVRGEGADGPHTARIERRGVLVTPPPLVTRQLAADFAAARALRPVARSRNNILRLDVVADLACRLVMVDGAVTRQLGVPRIGLHLPLLSRNPVAACGHRHQSDRDSRREYREGPDGIRCRSYTRLIRVCSFPRIGGPGGHPGRPRL
jgi:hypothetical protein